MTPAEIRAHFELPAGMTAREQIQYTAASFRNSDADLVSTHRIRIGNADKIANLDRRIRYQQWIEAVIRFRMEQR